MLERRGLERLSGKVREAASLAPFKRHVACVLPASEAVNDVGKARGAFGEVGRVDLRDVPEAHNF